MSHEDKDSVDNEDNDSDEKHPQSGVMLVSSLSIREGLSIFVRGFPVSAQKSEIYLDEKRKLLQSLLLSVIWFGLTFSLYRDKWTSLKRPGVRFGASVMYINKSCTGRLAYGQMDSWFLLVET